MLDAQLITAPYPSPKAQQFWIKVATVIAAYPVQSVSHCLRNLGTRDGMGTLTQHCLALADLSQNN